MGNAQDGAIEYFRDWIKEDNLRKAIQKKWREESVSKIMKGQLRRGQKKMIIGFSNMVVFGHLNKSS